MNEPRAGAQRREARRWVRHAVGGAAAIASLRACSARAACYGGDHHAAAVGIHLGLAFGGPGLPVKLNYGVTGRFGHDTAAFTRLEMFGLSALQLTAGITQLFGDSAFIEAGGTGVVGTGGTAAGIHGGWGPGGREGGLLIGGSLPLAGESHFKYLQLAPFIYPSEVCFPSGRALRIPDKIAAPT